MVERRKTIPENKNNSIDVNPHGTIV